MPATFVTLSQGDVFKSGGVQSIKIPAIDSIVGKDALAIYTSVSLQLAETVQYFLTFDDVIKFIHFGKGVGSFTVEGTMYSDNSGGVPGLSSYFSTISKLRGTPVKVSLYGGAPAIVCVLTNCQVRVSAEPDTMADFALNFSVVNHNI